MLLKGTGGVTDYKAFLRINGLLLILKIKKKVLAGDYPKYVIHKT